MKRILVASSLLCVIVIAFLNLHVIITVQAQANEKVWGTRLTILQSIIVGEGADIPAGKYAYVIKKQALPDQWILKHPWDELVAGDMTLIKNEIESKVPESRVQWIKVSWTRAEPRYSTTESRWYYIVSGLLIEAIVEHTGVVVANPAIQSGKVVTMSNLKPIIVWTPGGIALVLFAIAFLAVVIAAIIMGAVMIWEILQAVHSLPPFLEPWVMIVIGLVILAGLATLLYFLLGGKVSHSSKSKKGEHHVELGK